MSRMIFFGCTRSYTMADGTIKYACEYLSEEGFAHRDSVTATVYNTIKSYGIAPGTLVEGVFEVDSFNSIHLCDVNI